MFRAYYKLLRHLISAIVYAIYLRVHRVYTMGSIIVGLHTKLIISQSLDWGQNLVTYRLLSQLYFACYIKCVTFISSLCYRPIVTFTKVYPLTLLHKTKLNLVIMFLQMYIFLFGNRTLFFCYTCMDVYNYLGLGQAWPRPM